MPVLKSLINGVLPLRARRWIGSVYSRTCLPKSWYHDREFREVWAEWLASEHYPREQLEELQWDKFKKVLAYAYEKVPYYRAKLEALSVTPDDIQTYEDLTKLPIIEKEDVKRNPEKFIPEGVNPDEHTWERSSGSTGNPTSVLLSPRHLAVRRAVVSRYKRLAGFEPHTFSIAILRRSFKSDAAAERFRGEYVFPHNTMYFASTNMIPSVMDRYVKTIQRLKPPYIEAYSSAAYALAAYILETGKDVHVPVIITRTDQLYPSYAKAIAKAFHADHVHNFHGNEEQVCTGSDCTEHQGLHLNMEASLTESIDADGNQVFDAPGQVVGTNLENYAMPFIRYRLGDQIVLSKRKCPCGRGSYMISELLGRTDDLIQLANGRRVSGASMWLASENSLGLKEFQLVQKAPNLVQVNVSKYPDCDPADVDRLLENLHEHLGEDVEFKVVEHDLCPRINGKFKFIVNEMTESPAVA